MFLLEVSFLYAFSKIYCFVYHEHYCFLTVCSVLAAQPTHALHTGLYFGMQLLTNLTELCMASGLDVDDTYLAVQIMVNCMLSCPNSVETL